MPGLTPETRAIYESTPKLKIDQETVREKAHELNKRGEQDDTLVEQAVFEDEIGKVVEAHIEENREVKYFIGTFLSRLERHKTLAGAYKPFDLPAFEKGKLVVQAFTGNDETELTIDENGLTVPGYWINPKYEEGVDNGENMFIDGNKVFEFPAKDEDPLTVVLGRNSKECDVAISTEDRMSRIHLRLQLHPDRHITIQDVSKNGTSISVDGVKTREQAIKDMMEESAKATILEDEQVETEVSV